MAVVGAGAVLLADEQPFFLSGERVIAALDQGRKAQLIELSRHDQYRRPHRREALDIIDLAVAGEQSIFLDPERSLPQQSGRFVLDADGDESGPEDGIHIGRIVKKECARLWIRTERGQEKDGPALQRDEARQVRERRGHSRGKAGEARAEAEAGQGSNRRTGADRVRRLAAAREYAIEEHPAQRMADDIDLHRAGAPLHLRDRGWDVLRAIRIEIPIISIRRAKQRSVRAFAGAAQADRPGVEPVLGHAAREAVARVEVEAALVGDDAVQQDQRTAIGHW